MSLKTLLLTTLLSLTASAQDPPVGTKFSGVQTYYNTYDTYGSCGWIEHDSDKVAAISPDFGHNTECGRMVHITNPATGQSVDVQIVDTCPGCSGNKGHLDLSPAAAQAINSNYLNENVNVDWEFTS